LKPGDFSFGINPVIFEGFDISNTVINLHGGYGLGKHVDLSMRYSVYYDAKDAFFADFEWAVRKTRFMYVSLVTGAHYRYDMGLDGTLILSFPIRNIAEFYTGVDLDLEFGEEIEHYTWLPLGIEVSWRRKLSLMLEIDLPMSQWAWNIYGGGLMVYF
jgi:hypothetical protein